MPRVTARRGRGRSHRGRKTGRGRGRPKTLFTTKSSSSSSADGTDLLQVIKKSKDKKSIFGNNNDSSSSSSASSTPSNRDKGRKNINAVLFDTGKKKDSSSSSSESSTLSNRDKGRKKTILFDTGNKKASSSDAAQAKKGRFRRIVQKIKKIGSLFGKNKKKKQDNGANLVPVVDGSSDKDNGASSFPFVSFSNAVPKYFKYSDKKDALTKESAPMFIQDGKICYESSHGTLKIGIAKITKILIGKNNETPKSLVDKQRKELLLFIEAGGKKYVFVEDNDKQSSMIVFLKNLSDDLEEMNKTLSVDPSKLAEEMKENEFVEINFIDPPIEKSVHEEEEEERVSKHEESEHENKESEHESEDVSEHKEVIEQVTKSEIEKGDKNDNETDEIDDQHNDEKVIHESSKSESEKHESSTVVISSSHKDELEKELLECDRLEQENEKLVEKNRRLTQKLESMREIPIIPWPKRSEEEDKDLQERYNALEIKMKNLQITYDAVTWKVTKMNEQYNALKMGKIKMGELRDISGVDGTDKENVRNENNKGLLYKVQHQYEELMDVSTKLAEAHEKLKQKYQKKEAILQKTKEELNVFKYAVQTFESRYRTM